ncbi:hypothetical protein RRG08_018764 [Elysia crispata]|uniref:Uncharacterized protein n=1 Tax=Elysia crispata TaxID=231223 RepID=A0AAE1B1I4_9GAST|nr:hypothetical protein RRG08_018764 [Elysia crispata]
MVATHMVKSKRSCGSSILSVNSGSIHAPWLASVHSLKVSRAGSPLLRVLNYVTRQTMRFLSFTKRLSSNKSYGLSNIKFISVIVKLLRASTSSLSGIAEGFLKPSRLASHCT